MPKAKEINYKLVHSGFLEDERRQGWDRMHSELTGSLKGISKNTPGILQLLSTGVG